MSEMRPENSENKGTTAVADAGRRNQLLGALKEMLEELSNSPSREERCERCGLVMTHYSAHFWLDGVEESWEIPLPYCAKCEPEVGNRRIFAA